ncbi:hypothetical protein TNCV_5078531 [Trichonephila clavipes]|nr:hypothetical protein TNCV_5078531 [Trichonephila clavipes]
MMYVKYVEIKVLTLAWCVSLEREVKSLDVEIANSPHVAPKFVVTKNLKHLELLDSHNQELTIDELIDMHEQDIEELQSLDPVQKDRMTIGNLREGLSLLEEG